MISIEVVGIDDGLLDVRREGVSMGVIGCEVRVGECSVLRIRVEVDATGSNGIPYDVCEVVRFAWMCIHLGLLGDLGCPEFLVRTNCRYFDWCLVRGEPEGIVNVCLERRFWGWRDDGAGLTKFAKSGVEDDVWGVFMDGEICEDVLDGVVKFSGLGEVAMEVWQGCGVCDGK